MPGDRPNTVVAILAEAGWKGHLALDEEERRALSRSRTELVDAARRRPVYGVSRGFGPLADLAADPDAHAQGTGLVDHLTTGQGRPLPPTVTRLMVWLRLRGMLLGHSGVEPETWELLAAQWNAGFTPVVPQDGSLSASGDLVPLAHAARAAAGTGSAWLRTGERWRPEPAADVLARLGSTEVRWEARSALAFVNGTAASLARTLVNHARLAALARVAAAVTARLATLLGSAGTPFRAELAEVRGHKGHRLAAGLIRDGHVEPAAEGGRPFQEAYSLRCAPQVIGAVLDQLRLQESVLVTEASGCTDNPVLVGGEVHHGGNFHAAPVALTSEMHAVCVQQLAYLLERQLATVLSPHRNGGLPPLLANDAGRTSGFAGVQIAATSHLAAIRQRAYPASCTPVPTNLDNQDHVPMALNGANTVAEMLDRAWWIAASSWHALAWTHRLRPRDGGGSLWADLADHTPDLTVDRPMAGAVATLASRLEGIFGAADIGPEGWVN